MKRLRLFISLFCLLFILSACGNGSETPANLEEDETVPTEDSDNEIDKEEAIITDLGIYIGQADPHTVEIESNEGSKAFQLTEKSTTQIEELEPNDEVQFTYFVNEHEQNMLQSIEKMKQANGDETESNMIEATGIYNGQADPHTIEVETEKGPTAFQLSDQARDDVEKLTVGKEVEFTYYEKDPQLIIETITHTE